MSGKSTTFGSGKMGKRTGKGLEAIRRRVYFGPPPTPVTESERERVVLERLRADARSLAAAYRLPLRSLEAERPQVKRRYGICFDDGSVRIRLRHVRTGQLLKYSSLVDTLCHELAHLRHFDHGRRFHALYEKVLAYARRQGIYRPGPRPRRLRPELQHSLLVGLGPRPAIARARVRPEQVAGGQGPEQLELFPAPAPRGGQPLASRILS